MTTKKLSIIVVSYNTKDILAGCLRSIERFSADDAREIIVVDNHSSDGTPACIRAAFPGSIIIENAANVGYAAAVNEGLRRAAGDYVLILNSDIVFEEPIAGLIDFMDANVSVGIAGCAIYDAAGRLWNPLKHYPRFFSELYKVTIASVKDLRLYHAARTDIAAVIDVAWVEGCFMLARRPLLMCIGGMDERYFLYCEDVDLCRSIAKTGSRVIYYPFMKVRHAGGKSTVVSNATYLSYYYASCRTYLEKHYGWWYRYLFAGACTFVWILFLMPSAIAVTIYPHGKVMRKFAMLSALLRETFYPSHQRKA